MAQSDQSAVLREGLEKIRLYGSPWWKPEWGTPAKLANDTLNAADHYVASDEDDR